MMSLIFDQSVFKVLSLFAMSPGSRFKRNEIKAKTLLNNVPLDTTLAKMVKTETLKKEKNLYSINFENVGIKAIVSLLSDQYKNMKEVPFDIYLILVDLVYILSSSKETEAYLFGSYSKLVYKENSDMDIAVLTTKKFSRKTFEKKTNKIKKLYKKSIEVHYFDKFEFYKNKKDPLVKEILQNGVRLI